MNTRPISLILAIVLLILLSVFGLIAPFEGAGAPPLPVALFAFIISGIGGLIAAVGLWKLKRWALWLTIIISIMAIPVTVPGMVLAPPVGKVISVVLAVLYALVLVSVALPATRKAVAAARAPVAQA